MLNLMCYRQISELVPARVVDLLLHACDERAQGVFDLGGRDAPAVDRGEEARARPPTRAESLP